MGLLVLAHVDGDELALAAIQHLGQRKRGFGLAYAGRADEQEHSLGLVGILEMGARVRTRWATASRAWSWPMTRSLSSGTRRSTVSISSFTMRPSGTPVHDATISAIAWPSTWAGTIGASPWIALSSFYQGFERGPGRRRTGRLDTRPQRADLGHHLALAPMPCVVFGQRRIDLRDLAGERSEPLTVPRRGSPRAPAR